MSHDNPESVERPSVGGGIPTSTPPSTAPSGGEAASTSEGANRADIDPALLDDWWWMAQERAQGRFDEYRGQHIAVLGRKVVGADRNPMRLRSAMAAALNVDPERLVIAYIDRW
jgi:hypothetical protein